MEYCTDQIMIGCWIKARPLVLIRLKRGRLSAVGGVMTWKYLIDS
ncbi:uncharacterized protein G2W53_042472 [Senna tora]|uniref:Uncharacterized protein n=1 Tax=Senna tora TaxID=362788 RepID=A0A834W2F2_9FABA|nr:uncharacterized protein G2W53_042472 [Senna tora]